jgi:hypothetical protein
VVQAICNVFRAIRACIKGGEIFYDVAIVIHHIGTSHGAYMGILATKATKPRFIRGGR